MKKVAKIGAIVFLLFAGVSKPKASAILFFCGDICTGGQSCSRNCADDTTGFASTCGQWGCCFGHTDNC